MYQMPSVSTELPCTASSITRALENFLNSVDKMRETIMVPSRLKDTNVTVLPVMAQQQQVKEGASSAFIPSKNGGGVAGGPTPSSPANGADLFAFYRILYTIHQELTVGKSDSDFGSPADDDLADETTQKLKMLFRHHLHGMFSALRQLTDAANQMSKHYQEQIGELSLD
uniref:Uncharacterized protein n=1 Tax=Plectus sambesii TaxID=2011161 RepID=A0A914WBI6_9BILA